MPKQGNKAPWEFKQDYYTEAKEFPAADLEDGTLVYQAFSEDEDETIEFGVAAG
jgi:hypothetical protein